MGPATPRSLRPSLRRLTCGALTVLSLTAAGPSAAHAAPDPSTTAWKQAVRSHTPGQADAALETVAAIKSFRILNALSRGEIADRDFLTRALVLHTDLAIVQHPAAEQGKDVGGRARVFVLEDGRSVGQRQISPHWAIAEQIADILAEQRDPDARRVALLWFRTVSALFQHWAEGALAFVDRGLFHYPDDAWLQLYRGTVHQRNADGRVQQFLSGTVEGRGYVLAQPAFIELARGETALRRALELDATLAEARVRLAHVVGDREHPDEAVALAREALGTGLPPFFESYATLILGRNLARLGRFEEARAAFDRAVILAPTAQAPRIGRSQVALAAGRQADALSALTDVLGPERPVAADTEAWAIYFRVHDPVAAVQLEALRAEVR